MEAKCVTENPESIWQCQAYRVTAERAIKAFARTYWAQPRKAIAPDVGFGEEVPFKVARGLAEYFVWLNDDGEVPVWVISKLVYEEATS